MIRLRLRQASKEDALEFYDHLMKSMRAWVIENEEELLGIGGFLFHKNGLCFFVKTKTNCPKKLLWKASKLVMQEGAKYGLPIMAIRDSEVESSARYLTKLGFSFSHSYNNEEIWLKQ
jgi:hypothetical protein